MCLQRNRFKETTTFPKPSNTCQKLQFLQLTQDKWDCAVTYEIQKQKTMETGDSWCYNAQREGRWIKANLCTPIQRMCLGMSLIHNCVYIPGLLKEDSSHLPACYHLFISLLTTQNVSLPASAFLTPWKKSSTSPALLSGEPPLLKCLSKHGKISRIYLSTSVSSWSVSCWSASLWCFCEVLLPPPHL